MGEARSLFTRVLHPAPCHSPRANLRGIGTEAPLLRRCHASSKAGGSPRAIPHRYLHLDAVAGTSVPSLREKDASHRLLQPTSFTSTIGLPDSRLHSALSPSFDVSKRACRLTLAIDAVRRRSQRAADWDPPLACRMSLPGGASLDGEAPASTILAQRARRRSFRHVLVLAAPHGPGGVTIARLLRAAPPGVGALRAGPSWRSSPLTSVVAAFRGPDIAAWSPSLRAAVSRCAAVPSRRAVSRDQGRLPSSECSLPLSHRALSRLHVGSRGARHRCRCTRGGGFRHRDPASGACSPAEHAGFRRLPAG